VSKMIVVFGSPGSGKTSFAIKLGQEIYESAKGTVLLFHPDMRIPALALLFPHRKAADLFSVGAALNKTDITPEDVTRQIVTAKDMKNFGFLGFTAGENKYTYPVPTEDKIKALFGVLKGLADLVIVDCTSDHGDIFTGTALREADTVLQLCTPDLKSMAYFSSQLPLFADTAFNPAEPIRIMNIPDADLYMPVEEAKTYFKDISFTLPYSRALKQQMLDGSLTDRLKDKRYCKQIAAIAEKVG
jgi:cellulose biosynthesis protein BcsQ